jgi:SAM-dependent methyltransferase
MGYFRKISNKLITIWFRYAIRDTHYKNNFKKLNLIYLLPDPWKVKTSPGETYRFNETNRIIRERFGNVDSILEIGCGEGYQSLHLSKVCNRLIGLDVSTRAVERARRRVSDSEFIVGDIFSKEVNSRAPFDLIVACEVLYYMSDVSTVLQRMRVLGHKNLVTYYERAMDTLDPQILSLPGVKSEILKYEGVRWRVVWWQRDEF